MTIKSFKDYEKALKPFRDHGVNTPKLLKVDDGKTYWSCFKCEGHGMYIKDNKYIECDECDGIGSCS